MSTRIHLSTLDYSQCIAKILFKYLPIFIRFLTHNLSNDVENESYSLVFKRLKLYKEYFQVLKISII